ncbi:MAG TPA: chemotaxis protein CheB [Candidatus Binatia bacterium]|jgi:two-component system chemotaxis response regulator CheB|nr:chemotaxis protein CheB [Candidatus Binatia bacterium]
MREHDIIVIGSSAGGIKALTTIITNLPADINASIFIVQHLASNSPPNILPRILRDVGSLPAIHPADGEKIENGKIYVAPPDFHLLVERGHVRVVRGPEENRFRPAIDALFRSAARTYGARVLGVLLTGNLDDGTVGLQAIKKRGGVTIVQDPNEAEYPPMPRSALRYVQIDYCLSLSEIASLLLRLTNEPVKEEGAYAVPKAMEFESNIAEQRMNTQEFLDNVEQIGTRTTYTCPQCSGSIWQIGKEQPLRFRCHVGHSFTAGPFLSEQTSYLEHILWSAVRALEEKVTLVRQVAQRMKDEGAHNVAMQYEEYAENVDKEVSVVRELILNGHATKRAIVADDQDKTNDS